MTTDAFPIYKRGQKVLTDRFDMNNVQHWEPATVLRRSTAKDRREDGPRSFDRGEWYNLRMSDGRSGLWTHASRIRAITTTDAQILYTDSKPEREWLKRFCAQEGMSYDETRQRLLAGGPLKIEHPEMCHVFTEAGRLTTCRHEKDAVSLVSHLREQGTKAWHEKVNWLNNAR